MNGVRLELMKKDGLEEREETETLGLAHLAISVETKKKVDEITLRFKKEDVPVLDGPRFTGDGYYESVILDPEGNRIEITLVRK